MLLLQVGLPQCAQYRCRNRLSTCSCQDVRRDLPVRCNANLTANKLRAPQAAPNCVATTVNGTGAAASGELMEGGRHQQMAVEQAFDGWEIPLCLGEPVQCCGVLWRELVRVLDIQCVGCDV